MRRLDNECAEVPTLAFDAVVDTFFILDVVLTFQTGLIVPGTGEYIDDRLTVWSVREQHPVPRSGAGCVVTLSPILLPCLYC
jgi:hypothetical protein